MTPSYLHTPALHVLTRAELADIELAPSEVIQLVEEAYLSFASGQSGCPTKLMLPLPNDRDSLSYSMLGYDGGTEMLAFKTSYRQGNTNYDRYYPTISLYDDTTGMPFAFMDCLKVGGYRTPASTAIIAKYCSKNDARSALMIGSGRSGVNTLPYLLTAMPQLETLRLFGTHSEGIALNIATFKKYFPDREVELVGDVPKAVAMSDIVVAASGRASHPRVQTRWLAPGGLLISVASKGVEDCAFGEADYKIATNKSQMFDKHRRLAGPDGILDVDAELPDIIAGRQSGRRSQGDKVFAFNSGMVITDIPIAHAFATRAIAAGRGRRIELWS